MARPEQVVESLTLGRARRRWDVREALIAEVRAGYGPTVAELTERLLSHPDRWVDGDLAAVRGERTARWDPCAGTGRPPHRPLQRQATLVFAGLLGLARKAGRLDASDHALVYDLARNALGGEWEGGGASPAKARRGEVTRLALRDAAKDAITCALVSALVRSLALPRSARLVLAEWRSWHFGDLRGGRRPSAAVLRKRWAAEWPIWVSKAEELLRGWIGLPGLADLDIAAHARRFDAVIEAAQSWQARETA